ncbi:hypothetical protein [Sulfuricurvum sp.]|uniref:hypothetical protein n=1 Tax=Sulfuricurvum sp. TaxID=2025608 RepID=UPI003BB064EB
MIELLKSKEFYLFFGLYLVSNIFLLLNVDGLYWDDWIGYHQDNITLAVLFGQIQHGIKGDIFVFFSHLWNGIYGFRLFVFIATFTMGILVYLILKNIKELDKNTLFFLTAFFLIIPVNSAKISIAVVPFIFPVLLFYLAFYFLTLYLKHPFFVARIAILALFFTSFSTNSLLVFYFSIFMYIYYFYFHFSYGDILEKFKFFLKKYWDFLLLPFVYFIYKSFYLKPYGVYENYNTVSLSSLPKAIMSVLRNFDNSMFEVIGESLYSITSVWVIVLVLIYALVKRNQYGIETKYNRTFLMVGIILFFLAVFPYAMVGKNAEFESWNSRFQILTPLGLSFVYYFGVQLLGKYLQLKEKIILALTWLLVFSFVGKNISDQYKEHIDWFYSVSIRENIKENDLIRQHTTFIVNNNIKDMLFYKRDMIYYELNGIFKSAFGDEKRLAIRYDHYINDIQKISKLTAQKQYNFSQWESEPLLMITVSHNYKFHSGQDEYLRMIYLNITDHQKFLAMAKDLTTITVDPLPEDHDEI